MNEYRISKYNPIYYIDGKYALDEWTSYSDIGKRFDNKLFTKEAYIAVENNYLAFIKELLNKSLVTHMLISKYENYSNLLWKDKQKISNQSIDSFMRNCLREECWGTLNSKDLIIYVGYDFYLHIKSNLEYDVIKKIANSHNLFCQSIN